MRFWLPTVVSTLTLMAGLPAHVAAHEHAGQTAVAAQAMPADQVMKGGGLVATLHVMAPAKAAYTCSMHPEVAAARAGKCPVCKMDLEKQTHAVTLAIAGADGKAVAGAKVLLSLEDAQGMSQELALKPGSSGYTGAFALAAGKHKVKASVTRGKAKPVVLTTTLAVK